jgi:hypothetical protein
MRRGLAFGGWGRGLALGRRRRQALRQVRLLSREQMRQPFGCICDDKACAACTPEAEPKRPYWYRYTHTECVLCGRGGTYKERVYDEPKPEEYWKRHIYEQYLCGDHYLFGF